ncbi:DMT family transporter [Gottschalkiaceae bacterium SANA]|nr:DMT family transporter [Gottschalkiaceae bacterium SANA]
MDNKPKAVLYMLISACAFAVMGAMVKLSGNVPVFEKVFFRNLVSLMMAYIMIKNSQSSFWGKRENRKLLLARASLGLLGVVLYFYAISNLILADSAMLNKLSPFFVTLFAALFLKEKLSAIQIPALIVVFFGAMLIIKPQFDLSILPAMAGAASAMTAGAAYTLVRYLKDREKPATIVFYFSFVSVVGMIPFVLLDFHMPTMTQLFFLIGTGVFAAVGQFALTFAYKYAPAAEISIYNYFSILFSAVIGYLIWGEVPDGLSLLGGALVVAAAGLTFWYSNRKVKTQVAVSVEN